MHLNIKIYMRIAMKSMYKYWQVKIMAIGISTACLYPLETEKCLKAVGEMGADVTEIFFNAASEIEKPFIKNLCEIRDNYGLRIKSVHHYASFAESYAYFTGYERRFRDGLEDLKRYFDAMNTLGADVLVLHGAKLPCLEDEQCFERFGIMHRLGREYGISVAQENVWKFRSESLDYLKSMKACLGEEMSVTLDIKQARLAGYSPFDFVDALGESIVHFHISDYNEEKVCIPPLEGMFDFKKLFDKMSAMGYSGDYMIELYRNSYDTVSQITDSKTKLEKLF